MFLPILVYVPSLAFNQGKSVILKKNVFISIFLNFIVTGIDLHLTGTVVTVICIFYTVLVSKDLLKKKICGYNRFF